MTILTKLIAAAAAVFIIGAGSPALAEEANAPTTASAEALDLARRYVTLIQMDRQMDATFKAMVPMMMQRQLARFPQVTPAMQETINAVMLDVMARYTRDMIGDLAPIIAETFTVEELRAAVAFYESPPGRSMIAKAPSLAPKVAQLAQKKTPALEREIIEGLCASFGCPKDALPQTKS